MKINFYALLLRILIPVWFTWQVGWYLAFNYGFDYQNTDPQLLIGAKLDVEALYFLASAILLYRRMKKPTPLQWAIVLSILGLCGYTILGGLGVI